MVAALLMGACYNEEVNIIPSDNNTTSVTLPEDATQGEVIIKFKPEMEALLDATMTLGRRCHTLGNTLNRRGA